MSAQRESSPPPTPRSPSKKSPCRSSSAVSSCRICLGDVDNKSVTNTCNHEFCFQCLREWSKIKAECPLCKRRFSVIYHSRNSDDDYDEYVVGHQGSSAGAIAVVDPIRDNLQIPNVRIRAPLMTPFLRGDWRNYTSTSFTSRRHIYEQNLWAIPFPSSLFVRESSPIFYRRYPEQVERLVPWIRREFIILLGAYRASVPEVMDDVLFALNDFPIRSPEFTRRMRAQLGPNAPHFGHELYLFAISPFGMGIYDILVEYTALNYANVEIMRDSDSDVET